MQRPQRSRIAGQVHQTISSCAATAVVAKRPALGSAPAAWRAATVLSWSVARAAKSNRANGRRRLGW